MYNTLSKKIITDEGIYYLDHTFSEYKVSDRDLSTIGDCELIGFAQENVVSAYEDYPNISFQLTKNETEQLSIACFLPSIYVKVPYLFQLVSILNQLPSSNFSLYIHPQNKEFLQPFCNEHINVIEVKEHEEITIKTNILLTYGMATVHFLKIGFPVLILGPNGLGGLVTPDNLNFLYQTKFMGRPGGTLYERMPVQMVAHEVGFFKDLPAYDELVQENRTIAKSFKITPLSKTKNQQKLQSHQLREIYNNELTRKNLLPKLCSNMLLIRSGEMTLIRRTRLFDTLCIVNYEDAEFIKEMNGKNNCIDIQEKHNIGDAEFWQIIEVFLDKGIINLWV